MLHRPTVPAICQFCGVGFDARVDLVKAGKGKFCSNSCSARSRTKPLLSQVDISGGPEACWPWIGHRHKQGYGRVTRNGRRLLAHRVVYEELIGPIAQGMDLLHRCDNPPCCNPKHHFQGTHADNMADMAAKGRCNSAIGERQHLAQINSSQAKAIKTRLSVGQRCPEISAEMNISQHIIYDIKRGRTWRHVSI